MSNDQGENQSTKDDTPMTEGVKVEVNGREMTPQELAENYKNLQGEFTRTTQELSELKKGQAPEEPKEPEQVDEKEEVKQLLKKQGFVTVEDLESKAKEDSFFQSAPELAQQRTAIVELAKANNMSPEDVAIKYWFSTQEKLERAKQGDLKGNMAEVDQKEVRPSELYQKDPDQYEEWRKKNLKRA